MDWYYGSDINDSLVPRDEDLLDRLPSPDSWSNWGISAPKGFNSTEMFNTNNESYNNKFERGYSLHDNDQSPSSILCRGLPEQSFQETAFSCDHPKFQLQDLARFEQMDDSFLDFVHEDLPCVENVNKSFYFYPDLRSNITPGGLEKDITASQFVVPCFSESNDCLDIESPPVINLDPFEQTDRDEAIHEELSVEEFILQDLEMVVAQLTSKSRICFRDALYRLAGDTEQENFVQDQNESHNMQNEVPPTDCSVSMKSMIKKPVESQTNTVDRAVACLMFNKMEINIPYLPPTTSVSSLRP